jgi:hypothetical protein
MRNGYADFVLPAEREVLGENRNARGYPMYIDAHGGPVLYWRADPAGKQMATEDRGVSPRGIYHWEDNFHLFTRTEADAVLTLSKGGEPHALVWGTRNYDMNNLPELGTFQAYIRDENVGARLQPQRADTFLLLTAGADGLFGTADDVTNFDHHGK